MVNDADGEVPAGRLLWNGIRMDRWLPAGRRSTLYTFHFTSVIHSEAVEYFYNNL